MRSNNGDTLPGIALTEGNVGLTGGGPKTGATGARCTVNGTIEVVWLSGNPQTITMTAGQERFIDCKSIEVKTGTFDIGFD